MVQSGYGDQASLHSHNPPVLFGRKSVMAGPNPQTCPVCGVKILVGVVGGDRVLFSAGPPGTRARLYARVCQYVQKAGCINASGAAQPPTANDYYKPDAPKT